MSGRVASDTGTAERSNVRVPAAASIDSVEIVILNWNGRHHLETCLEALSTQSSPVPWSIAVVDNGSSDDSVRWLRSAWMGQSSPSSFSDQKFAKLQLIEPGANLGFCGGNNLAIEQSSADALILLNNDTAPEAGWLSALVGALLAAAPDVAAVSGKLVDWRGELIDFVEGVMTFDGHAFQRGFRRPLSDGSPQSGTELLFACGGNMIVRRQSFLEAGGFDPNYFAYLEDVDLGWRLWSGGERVVYCDEAVARHRSMASSEALGQHRRGFLFERNAFLTVFKNLDDEHFGKLMPMVYTTLLARTRTLIAENNRGGRLIEHDPYGGEDAQEAQVDEGVSAATEAPQPSLWQKWRGWGTVELTRRGLRRALWTLADWVGPKERSPRDRTVEPPSDGVHLVDGRSMAQLQAVHWLMAHQQEAAADRRFVQARRRRSDREIFERFPLALVPTYPGDEALFADAGFRSLLPSDVPIEEYTLDALMDVG